MRHNSARTRRPLLIPCFGRQRLATSSSRAILRLITSISHLAPRLALPCLIPHVSHRSHISSLQRFALPHLISSRAPPLLYLTSPRTSHFRTSSHPAPHRPYLFPPTLRTSAPHPILHLTFPYPAFSYPAPRSLIPLTPICTHPVPSTLAHRLTPRPKSSLVISMELLKNTSDRSRASTQFDPDSISVQPTPARPQSMNFL